MSTVTALQSFVGVLKKDERGPGRVEHHSQFPNAPSVFPGPVIKQGEKIDIVKGQNFEDNHPAVKRWPSLFGLVETLHPVEQATKKGKE